MASAHSPRIITDGLVLCLDAGNTKSYPGSGTSWSDLSGQGNNGTLTNGPTYSSDNGGAIVFDGSNDYVSISNMGLSSNTLEGWIKSYDGNQGGGTDIVSVLGKYSIIAAEKYTYIGFFGGDLTFRIDKGVRSSSHLNVHTVSYTANQWYHVALTYNSSNGSAVAYINGSNVGSTTAATGIVFDNTPNSIARAGNGNHFNGAVSVTKIYNKALTATEVQQNYNALKGRYQ